MNDERSANGRLGGNKVKERYGADHFREIGRKGGKKTKETMGAGFYERIGRKGGRRGGPRASTIIEGLACFLLAFAFLTPIMALACGGNAAAANAPACGKERWAVKTLSDADAGRVQLTPTAGTVADLRSLNGGKPPVTRKNENAYLSKRFADELKVYAVKAKMVGWKIEADGDFHIVLADPDGPLTATLIAEPPDPRCEASRASGYAPKYQAARAALEACWGTPTNRYTKFPAGARATIVGVAFHDLIHGQTGVAPNGIEIHPVLEVRDPVGCRPK